MNETQSGNESKKQKWIKAEHDKAVQIHWDNLARINDLKIQQSTKIYRIYSYQISHNKLNKKAKQKYDLGLESIREEQLKHCIEVSELQKEIDKISFEKSVEIMHKNSNEEMLSRKYDRLFKKSKVVKNG